jgi:hypothetical protein
MQISRYVCVCRLVLKLFSPTLSLSSPRSRERKSAFAPNRYDTMIMFSPRMWYYHSFAGRESERSLPDHRRLTSCTLSLSFHTRILTDKPFWRKMNSLYVCVCVCVCKKYSRGFLSSLEASTGKGKIMKLFSGRSLLYSAVVSLASCLELFAHECTVLSLSLFLVQGCDLSLTVGAPRHKWLTSLN